MNAPTHAEHDRLQFLCELVELEATDLTQTGSRLFGNPMTTETAAALPTQPDLSERVDAFVARLSRRGGNTWPHLGQPEQGRAVRLARVGRRLGCLQATAQPVGTRICQRPRIAGRRAERCSSHRTDAAASHRQLLHPGPEQASGHHCRQGQTLKSR